MPENNTGAYENIQVFRKLEWSYKAIFLYDKNILKAE